MKSITTLPVKPKERVMFRMKINDNTIDVIPAYDYRTGTEYTSKNGVIYFKANQYIDMNVTKGIRVDFYKEEKPLFSEIIIVRMYEEFEYSIVDSVELFSILRTSIFPLILI